MRRHGQDGRRAAAAEVPGLLAVLQVPELEAAVAGARERRPQPGVARAADQVHRRPVRGHGMLLERRVIRHRLGPPHQLLRGRGHAQAHRELLLESADADVRLHRDAGQAPAPHAADGDLKTALWGRGPRRRGVAAERGRRARRRRGDAAARWLLCVLDGGQGCGDAGRLQPRGLPETLGDEGVGVGGALAEEQLEERVHELVQAVPVEVRAGLCFGVAPAHREARTLGIGIGAPFVGDRARRCVGLGPVLPFENLQRHAHLPPVASLEGHPATAVRIGLRKARPRRALSQQGEHVYPQRPRACGELEGRRTRQGALPARGARADGENATIRQPTRVEDAELHG
mmetsp:Transcript_117724/g.366759  ORF Transcript_117724/g.366759 Transcript_117724/m.366759 type:complete len:344 (-) Transcript_117724:52-1083(-)